MTPPINNCPKGFREAPRVPRGMPSDFRRNKKYYVSWSVKTSKWVVRVRIQATGKLKYVGQYDLDLVASKAAIEAYDLHNKPEVVVAEELEEGEIPDDNMDVSLPEIVMFDNKENVPPDVISFLDDLPSDIFDGPEYLDVWDHDKRLESMMAANEPIEFTQMTPVTYAVDIIFKYFQLHVPSAVDWTTVISQVWREQTESVWPLYHQIFPSTDFGSSQFTIEEFGTYSSGMMSPDVIKAMLRSTGDIELVRTRSYEQFMSSSSPMLVFGVLHGQNHIHTVAVTNRQMHILDGRIDLPLSELATLFQVVTSVYIVANTVDRVYSH